MRALTLDFDKRTLFDREVVEPVVNRDDEVLIRVLEAGVCGTDRELAAFHFGYPPEGSPFLVIGHEALGEVVRAGSAVTGIAPGDLVVPMVRRACSPPCAQCRRGRRDLCLTGKYTERGLFGRHGYFCELAVDRAEDLVPVPREIADVAALAEPLSVVEKAVSEAMRLHAGEPRNALVIGAGSIGILAALVLRLRGFDVEVCSIEAPGSARARLVETAGFPYVGRPSRAADVVIEAAGSPEAATIGLKALSPLGVLMVLGAHHTAEPAPLIDLIVGNRVVAGSVNASPAAVRSAVADLAVMPRAVLRGMVERLPFSGYARSVLGPPPAVPKIIHVISHP